MVASDAQVRVRNLGQVSSTLEYYADLYRQRNPGRVCRYVYDPQHKPELSRVLMRSADGYVAVTKRDLGLASTADEENEKVRIGDLVLMGIDAQSNDLYRRELGERAESQKKLVDQKWRETIEAENEGASVKGQYSGPLISPVGGAAIESRTHEYEIDPSAKREDR